MRTACGGRQLSFAADGGATAQTPRRQGWSRCVSWSKRCTCGFDTVHACSARCWSASAVCGRTRMIQGALSVEVVISPEPKPKPPGQTGQAMSHQQLLQQLLDHLLWTITLERGLERQAGVESKVADGRSSVEVTNAPVESNASGPSSGETSAARAPSAPAPGSGVPPDLEASAEIPSHPLAFVADSVLFVLQNILVCFPPCPALLLKHTPPAHLTGSEVVRGQWAPHGRETHWIAVERHSHGRKNSAFLHGVKIHVRISVASCSRLGLLRQ